MSREDMTAAPSATSSVVPTLSAGTLADASRIHDANVAQTDYSQAPASEALRVIDDAIADRRARGDHERADELARDRAAFAKRLKIR